MIRKLLLWLALSSLIVSCSAATLPAPTLTPRPTSTATQAQLPSTSTPLPPTPSATAPMENDIPANTLLFSYKRTGGIMGRSDSWKVYSDGRIESNHANETLRATSEEVEAIYNLLLKADIPALSKATKAPIMCADCFNFIVTIYQRGEEYTYTFTPMGHDSDLDDAMVTALDAFIKNAGRR
jgi:hypothetical protein